MSSDSKTGHIRSMLSKDSLPLGLFEVCLLVLLQISLDSYKQEAIMRINSDKGLSKNQYNYICNNVQWARELT